MLWDGVGIITTPQVYVRSCDWTKETLWSNRTMDCKYVGITNIRIMDQESNINRLSKSVF